MSFRDLQEKARGGGLRPGDLVWQPDFGREWKKAAQVDGLFASSRRFSSEKAPSVRLAARQAWRWTGDLLWRPFILNRWFSIGFCAWIMTLGHGGCNGVPGFSGSGSGNGSAWSSKNSLAVNPEQAIARIREFFTPFGGMIVIFLLFGLFVLLALALLLSWLRARGAFMVLYRMENKDGTIGEAWKDAAGNAERLFAWKIVLGIFGVLLLAGPAAWGFVRVLNISDKPPLASVVRTLAAPASLFVLASLLAGLFYLLTSDFLEPVMYWQRRGVRAAWGSVGRFIAAHPWAVVRFELLKVALLLLASGAVLAVGVLSCCIGMILMALPYIGTVVTLPLPVFFRTYGMSLLRQWEGLEISEDEMNPFGVHGVHAEISPPRG